MKKLILVLVFIAPLTISAQITDSVVAVQQIDSLLQIARTSCESGKFEEASSQNALAERLALENFGEHTVNYGKVCFNHGWVFEEAGNYPEAETWYIKAKNITEKQLGKEHLVFAVNLNSLGLLYYRMGNYEKAEPYYLEANRIKEKAWGRENPRFTGGRHNLGILYHEMGEYEKAEQIFSENLAIQEKILGREDRQYAASLNSLAILYDDMGNFQKAEVCFQEAIKLYSKIVGEDHPAYSYGLENLADLYLRTKKYEKAEEIYLKTISIRERTLGKEHPHYATTLDNLGLLKTQTGNHEAAEKLLLEAWAIRKKVLGEAHPEYAVSLYHLAGLYTATGISDKVESFYIEARNVQKNALGSEHPQYSATIGDLARFYLTAKQQVSTVPYLLENSFLSKKLIRRAITHLSEQEMQSYLASFQQNADLLFTFNHLFNSPEILSASFDHVLFHKGFLLSNAIQLEKILTAAPDDLQQDFFEWKALQRQLSGQYSLAFSERGNVEILERQLNDLEKNLAHQLNGFGETQRDVSWKEVQGRLSKDEAVIEFIRYNLLNLENRDSIHYGALVLKPGSESPLFISLFQEKQIVNLNAIRNLYADQKTGAQPNLEELVWRPLAAHLNGIKTIYYAPSGLLHRVNLGAIPINKTETIGDHFALHRINTSRQLVLPTPAQSQNPPEAQLFGGIEYDPVAKETPADPGAADAQVSGGSLGSAYRSLRDEGWPYLAWTKKEVEEIQRIVEKDGVHATLWQGKSGSEENFKQMGMATPSPKILHLATHGYFFPDVDTTATTGFRASGHPLIRSGLILAGANTVWQGKSMSEPLEDGILTAHEIAQMNLKHTELVVLSACDTGLGELKGNEGVYGLQRAFKLAGARYIMMSLWKVSDRQTYEFMTAFYREWLEKGMEIPAAFQAAQHRMREQYSTPFNPSFWAGFILSE